MAANWSANDLKRHLSGSIPPVRAISRCLAIQADDQALPFPHSQPMRPVMADKETNELLKQIADHLADLVVTIAAMDSKEGGKPEADAY